MSQGKTFLFQNSEEHKPTVPQSQGLMASNTKTSVADASKNEVVVAPKTFLGTYPVVEGDDIVLRGRF